MGRVCLLAIVIGVAGQSSKPNEFAIGPVTVMVPPPEIGRRSRFPVSF